jgi:hypothetical protein
MQVDEEEKGAVNSNANFNDDVRSIDKNISNNSNEKDVIINDTNNEEEEDKVEANKELCHNSEDGRNETII